MVIFDIICILKLDLIGEKCMKMTDREYAMWDRLETMRSLALRVLGSEIEMLENSVVAYDSGKEYITIDHVQRAVYNLKRLRKEFKDAE